MEHTNGSYVFQFLVDESLELEQELDKCINTTCSFSLRKNCVFGMFQQMQIKVQVFALPLRLFELELELDNASAQQALLFEKKLCLWIVSNQFIW